MLESLLGTGAGAYQIVAVLELILAVYSIALLLNTDKKALKFIHGISAALWVVLALTNVLV